MFFKVLIIFIVVFYLLRFVFRIFLNPFYQGYYEGQSNRDAYKKRRKEGEVTIDYVSKKKKRFNSNAGEYVNYKEVK